MIAGRERHSTFHEQWYLVEGLTPRLRPWVPVRREVYWGATWYILSDPDNNGHFRLAGEAYAFVALLDGTRTVGEAWESCQSFREEALTQGEVITLLGRLHAANLLAVSLPADTDALLRRRQERRLKTVGSTLASFMFLRFPLWSPDAFFTRHRRIGGFIFSPAGMAVWPGLCLLALRTLVMDWDLLLADARQSLAPANLPWLYAVIILTKAVHEAGHAFACKYFSERDGAPGDVHSLGIMLLVLAPVPYIDVSSSVQIRGRWRRAMVALAGIYAELMLAFAAALVWAASTPDTALHILARNCMVIASASTLVFNANPLCRFDGYFVLTDLLGMPNLAQRSQRHAVQLFKTCVLGVSGAAATAHHLGERLFYPVYALAAFLFRLTVSVGIFLLLEDRLYAVGTVLTLALATLWFGLPLARGIAYLYGGQELAGRRSAALLRLGLGLGACLFLLLGVPMDSGLVAEGVVESRGQRLVFAECEGTLAEFAATDIPVRRGETGLARIANPGLDAELAKLEIAVRIHTARMEHARLMGDTNGAGLAALEVEASRRQLALVVDQTAKRSLTASSDGLWIAPELARRHGKWVGKGDLLGVIHDPGDLRLRVVVDQFDAARLFSEPITDASFRISGRADLAARNPGAFAARLEAPPTPAGRRELFHASLAQPAGGQTAVSPDAKSDLQAASRFFEVRLLPDPSAFPMLRPGQKGLVRLVFGQEPLGRQWLRRVRQFFAGH